MKGKIYRILSFMLAASMMLTVSAGLAPCASAAAVYYDYTYGDENGAKDESEIFDSQNMVDWTKSRIEGDEANPMFEAYRHTIDGEQVWTLKRQRSGSTRNNADGYVTYRADNATAFEVTFIIGMYQGKVCGDARFFVSPDNSAFTEWTTVIKKGEKPEDDSDSQRWVYTGYNLPSGTNYIRIQVPGLPDASDAGFKTVLLENVKIGCDAQMPGWDGEEVTLEYPSNTTAKISWPEFESDESFSYMISMDGAYMNTVDKSVTSYSVPVEENTEYRFQVAAVAGGENPTRVSRLISSPIKKTGGADGVFEHTFKFAETISNGVTWSGDTPVYDADHKGVHRSRQNNSFEAVYEIPEGIEDFEVTMMIYNPKSLPGETTFQIRTSDGSWVDAATDKTGDAPANYSFAPWVYKAKSVPEGATALKIIFGKTASGNNRQNSVQLHKVVIKTAGKADAYNWLGELSASATDTSIELNIPELETAPQDIKYNITIDDTSVEADASQNSYSFENLVPGKEYKFTVQAVNTVDESQKSPKLALSYSTFAQEDLWNGAKVEFAENAGDTEMIIPEIDGAQSVLYTIKNATGEIVAVLEGENTYTLTGLTTGSHDYTVQAVAEIDGSTHYSTWLYANVTIGDVERWSQNAKIDIYDITKNGFKLKWTKFENMDGRSYQIRINGNEAGTAEEESFEITGLDEGTVYGVSIVVAENGVVVSDALISQAETARNRDFYINFTGSDLSSSDWTKNSYYYSAEQIPMVVELNDAAFSLAQHANDPEGPVWGAFFRVADGSSPDSYIAVDPGAPLSSFKVQNLVTGADAPIKIEYAVDDGEPQATLGNFDSSEHTWISLEGSYSEVQIGTKGEWDDSKKVRKTDRQVYEHAIAKLPANARYFRIYFSKITAYTGNNLRPWRSGTLGFGGTYADAMTESANNFDFAATLAAGDTMESVTKNLNLPSEIDGYPVTWESSMPEIISADGTFSSENIVTGYSVKNITLTAHFRRNVLDTQPEISQSWNVTAVKNTEGWTMEQYLDFDLSIYADSDSITAPQSADAVYTSISLPEGIEDGSKFTWSVSDTAHAEIADGYTANFTLEKDKEVTLNLIMTAERDGITKSRSYPITLVRGYGDNIAWGVASITASSNKSSASNAATKNPDAYWENDAADTEPYLQYNFKNAVSMTAVMLSQIGDDIESCTVSVSSDAKEFTQVFNGAVLAESQKTLIPYSIENIKAVRVSFVPKNGSTVKISGFEIFDEPVTKDQIFEAIFNEINIPKRTAGNITLPETGYNGAKITWESSNKSVISNAGAVTPAGSAVSVTLTATVEYDGEKRQKSYPVSVPKGSGTGSGSSGFGGGGSGSGTGSGTAYIPPANVTAPPVEEVPLYSDVPKGHWAYGYIKTLTDKNVVSGIGANMFGPGENVTREAFLKMLLCAIGADTNAAATPFADVDSNAWYAPYVAKGYEMGIISGMDSESFGIGQGIRRQDMAVMADKLLAIYGVEAQNVQAVSYSDSSDIPEYAKESVAKLSALSVMSGSDNMFKPAANATRAEAARIVYEIAQIVK